MRTSDKGAIALLIHEGVVPGPYMDSRGNLTYGVGHTAAAGPPDPSTLQRGMPSDLDAALRDVFSVFRRDLIKYEDEVKAAVNVPLEQHEFDALVSFHFHTGGIARAALTRHLNNGDREAAANAFMGWSKPPEIIPRRQSEQRLFATGQYPEGRVNVWTVDDQYKVTYRVVKTLTEGEALELMRPRSMSESRTLRGGIVATTSTIGAVASETASEVLPLVPYVDTLKYLFVALSLAGIAYSMYARMDDWKKGRK